MSWIKGDDLSIELMTLVMTKSHLLHEKKQENVRIFYVKFILSHTYKYKIYLKYKKK